MIIAIMISIPVATDGVVTTIVEQVWNSWWLGVKNVVLRNSLDCAVIVADPTAVANMENICDIMAFACFLTVVIDHSKKLVLLLLLLIFSLQRDDFCWKKYKFSWQTSTKEI